MEAIEFVKDGEGTGIRIHQIPAQPHTDEDSQDDLARYIAKRKARDPQFAAGYEEGYAAFKAEVLQQLADEEMTGNTSKDET